MAEDGDRLFEATAHRSELHLVAAITLEEEPSPHNEVQPATADDIDHCVVLGKPQGVVVGCQDDAGADSDPARASRDR